MIGQERQGYNRNLIVLIFIVGFFIIAISTVPFVILKLDISIWIIVVFYTIIMTGISMIMMPLTTEGLNSLSNNLVNHGTAMINTLRQIGGSIGTALVVTIYTKVANNSIKSGRIENEDVQLFGICKKCLE